MTSTKSMESRLSVVESEMAGNAQYMERFDGSMQKISDVLVGVKEILAVHEERHKKQDDFNKTAQRIAPFLADPASRTFDNPKWVDFLLHDNDGKIRKPLRSVGFSIRVNALGLAIVRFDYAKPLQRPGTGPFWTISLGEAF